MAAGRTALDLTLRKLQLLSHDRTHSIPAFYAMDCGLSTSTSMSQAVLMKLKGSRLVCLGRLPFDLELIARAAFFSIGRPMVNRENERFTAPTVGSKY